MNLFYKSFVAGLAMLAMVHSSPVYAQSATTQTRIFSWPNPSTFGRPALLTAEVEGVGAPAGSISFAAGVTQLGSAWLRSIGAGQATLAAGGGHSCALRAAGGVACWGANNYGQLGDGTTATRVSPTPVIGLTDRIAAVVSGQLHACALTNAGAVKCWGANYYGQLGDGTETTRTSPVDVIGLSSGVIALAARSMHSCALTSAGEVKCWGLNSKGQAGNGAKQTEQTSPVTVVGLGRPARAITVGAGHSCALLSGGGVKCWGENVFGQLGVGGIADRLTPVDVTGLSSGIVSISAGAFHTCAIDVAGALKCWGDTFGRLPRTISGLPGRAVAVTAGREHTCALTDSGGVFCWGHNEFGQIGDNSNASDLLRDFRRNPAQVFGLSSGIVAITSGRSHNCALSKVGALSCWGSNVDGQLGDGNAAAHVAPVSVAGVSGGARGIAIGADNYYGSHSCAVTSSQSVKCWGSNRSGQLGDGTTTNSWTPVSAIGLDGDAVAVASGPAHSCALTRSGGVKCWGSNSVGQLGDGTTTSRLTPTDVSGLQSGVRAIAAGVGHNCALMLSGEVKCWGWNASGALGDGTTIQRLTPVNVASLSEISAIRSGNSSNCALTNAGGVKCWGNNSYGALGDGTQTDRPIPVDVPGLSTGVIALSVGHTHSCAVTSLGAVKCWGENSDYQLGDGTTISRYSPTPVVGLTNLATDIVTGQSHTCVIIRSGEVRCWGKNSAGQLGNGTMLDRPAATAVVGLTGRITSLSANGSNTTCALNNAGSLWCWGNNSTGEVGYGTPLINRKPTATKSFDIVARSRARMWTSVLGVGAHSVSATYNGDASHAPSFGVNSHTVR